MESLNSYVNRKIKFRKSLMITFSMCCFLLICSLLIAVQEKDTENYETRNIEFAENDIPEFRNDTAERKTPREIIMEKRDRNIRMYSAMIIVMIMAGTFIADLIFVKCPVCGKHIAYGVNPEMCRRCGSSFLPKTTDKAK